MSETTAPVADGSSARGFTCRRSSVPEEGVTASRWTSSVSVAGGALPFRPATV